MKRRFLPVAIVLSLCGSMLTTSCIGRLALDICPLPVYEVAALADILVLNSIEFWSGDNPVAAGKKVIDGKDGRYIVECDGKGYTITSENDKSVVRLDFDTDDQTWSVALPSGESFDLVTFIDDSHVAVPGVDGERKIVELSAEGLMAYREMVNESLMAAK